MGIWRTVREAEHEIRRRIKHLLTYQKRRSADELRSASDVRQEILEQFESRVKLQGNERIFPFKKVLVRLQPNSKSMSKIFKTSFIQNGSLQSDIIRSLVESKARYSDEMEISVEIREYSAPGRPVQEESLDKPLFHIHFLQPDSLYRRNVPEINLVVSLGAAERREYRLKKECILIGRSAEIEDFEGRMVRINDVVFLDNGDEINSTVSGVHARIWFSFEKQGFLVLDEGSRYGTRVVRGDRSIDVPSAHDEGILLRPGDEIYCGRASLLLGAGSQEPV